MIAPDWLHIQRSDSPLILAFSHGGTLIPSDLAGHFRSPWLALRDTDWHVRALYDGLVDATIVATDVSRSVIDANRDPSGASLYPGQATTGLCPTTSFDGDPLYRDGLEPDADAIAIRRKCWFDPYHTALATEIARLRALHAQVIVYDCHAIRSHIPRLFEGDLPECNIGTNGGTTCAPALATRIAALCEASGRTHVLDGRFKGGWTTRRYGQPQAGVHAIQMELACRTYLHEPIGPVSPENWPPPYDPAIAAPLRRTLGKILSTAIDFAKGH